MPEFVAATLDVRRYRRTDADAVWAIHEAALRASPLAYVEEAAVDDDVTEIEDHYLEAGGEFLAGDVDDGVEGPDADPPWIFTYRSASIDR